MGSTGSKDAIDIPRQGLVYYVIVLTIPDKECEL